jgi:hypothetical protein
MFVHREGYSHLYGHVQIILGSLLSGRRYPNWGDFLFRPQMHSDKEPFSGQVSRILRMGLEVSEILSLGGEQILPT